jgi:hypothetical protein
MKFLPPATLPAPGGDVVFEVLVDNTGPEDVTLTSLTDDIHGDLDLDTSDPHDWTSSTCDLPQTIAVGGSYECSFIAYVAGSDGDHETDTVTATAEDDDGNETQAQDSATVTITSRGTNQNDTRATSRQTPVVEVRRDVVSLAPSPPQRTLPPAPIRIGITRDLLDGMWWMIRGGHILL